MKAAGTGLGLSTSTLIGKEQTKRLQQLVQALMDNPQTVDFRQPVDWKTLGLLDYPTVITQPMDLSTVRSKLLGASCYTTVEECLDDIQLIWENCKAYNAKESWIHKLADKIEKVYRKMIKNYLPFIGASKKEKPDKKKEDKPAPVRVSVEPAYKPVPIPEEPLLPPVVETQEQRLVYGPRKRFLRRAAFCTSEQTGIIFLLIQKNAKSAVYINNGKAKIDMEQVDDKLLGRLDAQLDMWGVGLEPPVTKKK